MKVGRSKAACGILNPALANTGYIRCYRSCLCDQHRIYPVFGYPCIVNYIGRYWIILDINVLPFTMFLFQFVKHIIETVIEIYEILLIWWVDPQYPWSQRIGSLIWGFSMTRVNDAIVHLVFKKENCNFPLQQLSGPITYLTITSE